MNRKYLVQLEKWMKTPHRKPLIIWGARQVGKTYLIRELFAKKYYPDSFIYIDCRTEYQFTEFCSQHLNVSEIIEYISLYFGKKIDESTLLIFDETQECPAVLTLLKYFHQERPEIPVIVTGSMVRIRLQRISRRNAKNKGFLFPVGSIQQFTMYPMTFGEYLLNRNQPLFDAICLAYQRKVPLQADIHKLAMNTFYEYLMIGGMPEAVNTYLETKSYFATHQIIKDLYDNYLADMELYQASPESTVRARKIFQNIFTQLNKESKNFKCSHIVENARYRNLQSPIDWLTMAFVVMRSSLVKEHVTLPLHESDESLFRLYLSDVGMFFSQSGVNAASLLSDSGKNTLSGIFFENYAACELTAAGLPLFFWKGKGDSEFEFVVESDSVVIPIDVKKNRGKMNSLEKFQQHNAYSYAVKVSADTFGFDEKTGILTVPHYQFFLVAEDFGNGISPLPKFSPTAPLVEE